MGKKTKKHDDSIEELQVQYRDISKEIFDLNNELRMARKLEKPHLLREKKKNRARVLTALRQKGGTITR